MVRHIAALSLAALFVMLLGFVVYYTLGTDEIELAAQLSAEEEPVPYEGLYRMYVGENEFFVSLAADEESRRQGLSGTDPLRLMEGKLFVFPKSDIYGFWMKDMNYAIDILWFDAQGYLLHIERDVQPESYPKSYYPESVSRYVLELAAGDADKYGLMVGERMMLTDPIVTCLRNGCFSK